MQGNGTRAGENGRGRGCNELDICILPVPSQAGIDIIHIIMSKIFGV